MTDKKISIIIIKNTKNVDVALNQTFENYEYNVVDNNASDITEAVNKSTGDYIMFLDSDDTLIPNALSNINKMVYFTDSDVIKYRRLHQYTGSIPNISETDFQYVFQRANIMDYIFADLSELCIKKEIAELLDFNLPKHVLTMHILLHANDITVTNNVYISNYKPYSFISEPTEYIQIIDYILEHRKDISDTIWKTYFLRLIPRIVRDTTRQNNKDVFSYCCKHIPTTLIPLKYKIIFFIMKICI